eukprot:10389568-Heterocapsa_arctica.AAC.1
MAREFVYGVLESAPEMLEQTVEINGISGLDWLINQLVNKFGPDDEELSLAALREFFTFRLFHHET